MKKRESFVEFSLLGNPRGVGCVGVISSVFRRNRCVGDVCQVEQHELPFGHAQMPSMRTSGELLHRLLADMEKVRHEKEEEVSIGEIVVDVFVRVKTARGADCDWVIGQSNNAHAMRVFNGNYAFINHPESNNTVSKFAFGRPLERHSCGMN